MITTDRPQVGPPLLIPAAATLVLSIVTGALLADGPRPDTAASAIPVLLRDHDVRVRVVGYLVMVTALPLAVLGAALYRRFRRLGVTAPGPVIALAGSALAAASLMISGASLWTAGRAAAEVDVPIARVLTDLAFATGGAAFSGGLGLLVAGVAVTCLARRLVARPLAWAGVGLAAVAALSTLSLLVTPAQLLLPVVRFGGVAWLVAVTAVLPRTIHDRTVSP